METIKSPGILFYVLSFYSYYLPIILYVLWTPLSIYDLGKREDLGKINGAVWTFFIILVPWLGSLLYLLVGKSKFSTYLRMLLTIPGLILVLLFSVYSTLTST